RMFADDDEVLIPQVFAEYCSRRVLTMSLIEGYPLADILKPGIDQEMKDWLAIKYFRVTGRQIFEFGTLHTDPHPGNYLVTFHPRLALLNLGSIRLLPEPIGRACPGLAVAPLRRVARAMQRHLVTLGSLDAGAEPAAMGETRPLAFEPVLVDRVYDPAEYDS